MEARRHIEGPEQRFLFSRRNGYQFEWLWNLAEQAQPSFRMRRVRPCGTDFPYCPPLYHLYSPAAGWILENLTVKTHGRFGGREIDGHHCLGVQLHTASSLVYWLDPAKDGLPRLVEDIAAQEGWSWKCEEFRQLETGHWFPWRGHFGNAGVTAGWFEMQTVILNEPISRDSLALPALASISADVSFKEKTLPSTSPEPTWSSLLGAPWLLSIMVPLSGLLCFWRNLVPRAIISMAHSLREFVRSFFRKKEVEGLAR
jgi:hypothetical protein